MLEINENNRLNFLDVTIIIDEQKMINAIRQSFWNSEHIVLPCF